MRTPRILVIEPYLGGSHAAFLRGLQRAVAAEWTVMGLPARQWKWRMRLAAPFFAERLAGCRDRFDRVLSSTYLDAAAFRGLAPAWTRCVPLLAYFHENQFAYPVQAEDERDFHFALTNLTTALAADRLAFNSAHNLATFLEGARRLLRVPRDLALDDPAGRIRARSTVLPPGVDFADIDRAPRPPRDGGAPVVVWNHRWEHDKDPETFFEVLFRLDRRGVPFRLVVLGQSFERQPAVFRAARRRLGHRILHFGTAPDRASYAAWLRRGDVAVSTARHEFFGIAVLEAVRAGCRPLLPRRLAYPELFPGEFLYEEGTLEARLEALLREGCPGLGAERARALTEPFSWAALGERYRAWILDGAAGE
ncbi:DUF3524 domain-containing protein, partial [Dissulfurirhabdus thermomarina]